jgi:hypothetical protein
MSRNPSPKIHRGDFARRRPKAYGITIKADGYAIGRGLVPQERCDAIRALWNTEAKPHRGCMYRQATARAATHELNANGWIKNPILNLQSADP